MKNVFLLFCMLAFAGQLFAQDEKSAVASVIHSLFDGMRTGDSSMVHRVFSDDVRMFSSTLEENGKSKLQEGSLAAFLNAIGSPHDIIWDENIWNLRIDLDDHLAHAWMDYTFYAGDRLSHCGVNAMQLTKNEGSWKIIHLIDTRRKTGCMEKDH